jgi:RNA recognition motif-containing protein
MQDVITKKQMGHAFVHFTNRASAIKAKKHLEGFFIIIFLFD